LRYIAFQPDRDVNPQYADLPDMPKYAAIIEHPAAGGGRCESVVTFASVVADRLSPELPKWTMIQEDPLTLDLSVECACGNFHGHVKNGKWVPV
jgi:hypothetical protein